MLQAGKGIFQFLRRATMTEKGEYSTHTRYSLLQFLSVTRIAALGRVSGLRNEPYFCKPNQLAGL
jgi:hypothetical protein